MMRTSIVITASAFLLFILWIIYMANTGTSSFFFEFVRGIPYGDKLGHFGLFGLLTLLAVAASECRSVRVGKSRVYYGVVFVVAFAVVEELSQLFLATRTFDLGDLGCGMAGIALAAFAAPRVWAPVRNRTRQGSP